MLDMQRGRTLVAVSTAAQAQVTLTAVAGQRWSIGGIAWSYEGGTLSTDAELNIWGGSTAASTAGGAPDTNLMFTVDVNDDGAGFIIPAEPIKFPANMTIIFELTSGGTAVVGKINVLGAKLV